jgi:hypothetical protein
MTHLDLAAAGAVATSASSTAAAHAALAISAADQIGDPRGPLRNTDIIGSSVGCRRGDGTLLS